MPDKQRIIVTEDDAVQRDIIADILLRANYAVVTSASGEGTLQALEADHVDLLLTDMKMPGMDGLELLRRAKRVRPDLGVVVMTAHASVETAITAMKEGANDYLQKPFDKDQLLHVIGRALEQYDLRRENRQLRELVFEGSALGNIVGGGPAMQTVYDIIKRAVRLNTTVLIRGESGTGKELVARHIHFNGPRKDKPFIVVNCAAIPENLVESELFGHEKGAFTGADAARQGKFEIADTGTLFLDEIGDMQLESQAKLLRVLQDGQVERVGAKAPRKVDVRVIAATNRDLKQAVEDGEFREDLYYRLDVLNVHLPALRERFDDLPLLVNHFRTKLAEKLGITPPEIRPEVIEAMRRYRWPGNVRELEHTLEQMFILTDSGVVGTDQLPEKLRSPEPVSGDFKLPPGGLVLEDLERDLIRQALDRSHGSIKEAAELLGLTYKTLQYRLKKHEIDRKNSNGE